MTIYPDVLHNSILGEKDEPITVINLLHIKANVLKQLFYAAVLFSGGRKWKNRGNKGRPSCCHSPPVSRISPQGFYTCDCLQIPLLGLPLNPPWLQGKWWTEHPHLFRAAQPDWV